MKPDFPDRPEGQGADRKPTDTSATPDQVEEQNDRNTSADTPARSPKTNRIDDLPVVSDPVIDIAGPTD